MCASAGCLSIAASPCYVVAPARQCYGHLCFRCFGDLAWPNAAMDWHAVHSPKQFVKTGQLADLPL